MGRGEEILHLGVGLDDVAHVVLEALVLHGDVLTGVGSAVAEANLVGGAVVPDHRLELAEGLLVLLILAELNLLRVGEAVREPLVLVAVGLHLLEVVKLHATESGRDRVGECHLCLASQDLEALTVDGAGALDRLQRLLTEHLLLQHVSRDGLRQGETFFAHYYI